MGKEEIIDVVAQLDEAALRKIINDTYLELRPINNIIDITEGMFTVIDNMDIDDDMRSFFEQLSANFHLNKAIYIEMEKAEEK